MEDFILVDGDQVVFLPPFGAATVVPQPGKLAGSGPLTLNGKNVCVDGDEGNVSVAGCMYMTPQYCIPGTGTLKIASLAGDQKAKKTNTGGKAVLLKGQKFTAKFEVQSPAQQPVPSSSPVPDPTPQYSGDGMFVTTNTMFKGF
jgi:hypothetical protein